MAVVTTSSGGAVAGASIIVGFRLAPLTHTERELAATSTGVLRKSRDPLGQRHRLVLDRTYRGPSTSGQRILIINATNILSILFVQFIDQTTRLPTVNHLPNTTHPRHIKTTTAVPPLPGTRAMSRRLCKRVSKKSNRKTLNKRKM